MSYLLVDGTHPVEYRMLPPDDMTDERGVWEEVEDDDPRIAQILTFGTSAWGAFRIGLLDDETAVGQSFQGAIALFMATNPIKVSTLMSEASKDSPYVIYLVKTWNSLVDASGYVPGEGIVNGWNDLAVLHNVPLQWLPDAKLATATE